ncbi:DnaB-like helicase C-terminal domain-containing protein [Limnohabitans sp.]|jgi:replicative DNA helicase|uniref:DnaB-like helicase C-terminal domain-containing protein n=1 Tax=Limnohabitans sp. TaxID=1907725 RepID=UPI0037BE8F35
MEFDIFISHASEDKEAVARPLAEQLRQRGLRIWMDETEIKLGDSLRRSIDRGLSKSTYGLVVLSPDFLRKEWPQKELDGLVAREDGAEKVILPVWHNVTRAEVVSFSPPLGDKLAVLTSMGLPHVVDEILKVLDPASASPKLSKPSEDGSQSQDIHGLLATILDNVEALSDAGQPSVTGVPTGFSDLDLFTSGFQVASVVIVAGCANSGKTAFALNVAEHVACNQGLPVLIFTPNDSAVQTTNRILGVSSKIAASKLRVATLTDADWPVYFEAINKLQQSTIAVHDASDVTFDDIQMECRHRLNLHGALGLVIIDSIQNIGQPNSSVADAVSICRKIKSLAREIRSPILLISDLPRTLHSRADKRPTLNDLGDIDRFADVVLFLYRGSNYDRRYATDPEVVEVIVANQRDGGPTGTVRLNFHAPSGALANISKSDGDNV